MDVKEKLYTRAMGPCPHDKITRYGNRHGRYSRCEDCNKKWKWDDAAQKWLEPAVRGSRQPPLPSPSSSTAISFEDKHHTPALRMGLSGPSKGYTAAMEAIKDREQVKKPSKSASTKPKRTHESYDIYEPEEIQTDESFEWDKVDPLSP